MEDVSRESLEHNKRNPSRFRTHTHTSEPRARQKLPGAGYTCSIFSGVQGADSGVGLRLSVSSGFAWICRWLFGVSPEG